MRSRTGVGWGEPLLVPEVNRRIGSRTGTRKRLRRELHCDPSNPGQQVEEVTEPFPSLK